MTKVDRWLLPDGIEEILPSEASHIESLRRLVVDVFRRHGYDYVVPPMVEFIDSLLTGSGELANLDTFKVVDQLSGKTMGIRADITPQIARMDAHSLKREGINRLCYAGHVLYTKPKSPLASRAPIQVGVELFGESGPDADKEVISLLLETLKVTGLPHMYVDIGHVGVYRGIMSALDLSQEQQSEYRTLLQSKSSSAIEAWVADNTDSEQAAKWLNCLPTLAGTQDILEKAKAQLSDAPQEVSRAIDELITLNTTIKTRFSDAKCYFDLSELRGYHYYTGLIFGAFAPGVGNALANGGRYDHVGESFGRARPATGFTANLTAISQLTSHTQKPAMGIYVAPSSCDSVWQEVCRLRDTGERVVVGLSSQKGPYPHQMCNRELVKQGDTFKVIAL